MLQIDSKKANIKDFVVQIWLKLALVNCNSMIKHFDLKYKYMVNASSVESGISLVIFENTCQSAFIVTLNILYQFLFCNNFLLVMKEKCMRVSIQMYSRSHTTKLIPFHMINHHYAWKILTSAAFYSCQPNVVSKLNYYSYIHHLWTTRTTVVIGKSNFVGSKMMDSCNPKIIKEGKRNVSKKYASK